MRLRTGPIGIPEGEIVQPEQALEAGEGETEEEIPPTKEMINRDIRREENEWIGKELANLGDQGYTPGEIARAESSLESEIQSEIASETASEGNLTEEQFQDSLTEWEAMMDEAKEASAKIPEKEKPALTPEGYERLPFTQTTIEGKEEPIFQKKEEEERKPESQGAMFTNLLGQELVGKKEETKPEKGLQIYEPGVEYIYENTIKEQQSNH